MKVLKITSYSDDGHGWYAVKTELLHKLEIYDKISCFSYVSPSNKTVYLEEDYDISIFINRCKELNINIEVSRKVRCRGKSKIRDLRRVNYN